MTSPEALLLGLLQGASEFLPVSSSGHLFLAQRLLGFTEPELAFDTLLHLATLFAVAIFLRSELLSIARDLFRRGPAVEQPAWGRRDLLLVVLATVPTVAIGLFFKDAVEQGVSAAGVGGRYLVLTALLLLSARMFRTKAEPARIEAWEAILVGCVQGMAVFPGLSRSGSTICVMLLLGVAATRAPRFSFLISLPAVAGAAVLNLRHAWAAFLPPDVSSSIGRALPFLAADGGAPVLPGIVPSLVGFVAALFAGYLALRLVDRLVVAHRFQHFAPYTAALAALAFFLHFG